jgi:hypothetical protein
MGADFAHVVIDPSRLAKKAGFTHVSLHTLRHSFGSQLISEGVPLPTVSKILGHSNVYVTATVYAHALASDESGVAEKWQAAMRRAENSKVIEIPRHGKKPRTSGVVANGSTEPTEERKITEAKRG